MIHSRQYVDLCFHIRKFLANLTINYVFCHYDFSVLLLLEIKGRLLLN